MHLGDTTNTAAVVPTTTTPGFTDGLMLWSTPGTAVTTITGMFASPSTAFSSAVLPFTAGVLVPPLAILAILLGGRGR